MVFTNGQWPSWHQEVYSPCMPMNGHLNTYQEVYSACMAPMNGHKYIYKLCITKKTNAYYSQWSSWHQEVYSRLDAWQWMATNRNQNKKIQMIYGYNKWPSWHQEVYSPCMAMNDKQWLFQEVTILASRSVLSMHGNEWPQIQIQKYTNSNKNMITNDHLDIKRCTLVSLCMAMNGHKSGGCGFPLSISGISHQSKTM